jgi:MFS family permease
VSAIVTDLAPVELRARYLGVVSMTFSSALMIAAPVGGIILNRLGGVYVWVFCFGLAMTAAAMFLSIRTRIAARATSDEPPDPAPPGAATAPAEAPPAAAIEG